MNYIISALFIIPGVINFAPIVGTLSNTHLLRLYQLESLSADLAVLLRHRAFLFGIIGALIITAAFQSSLRTYATIAGMVSMVSFIVLVITLKTSNPSLIKVAWIDVFAIISLAVGYLLHLRYT